MNRRLTAEEERELRERLEERDGRRDHAIAVCEREIRGLVASLDAERVARVTAEDAAVRKIVEWMRTYPLNRSALEWAACIERGDWRVSSGCLWATRSRPVEWSLQPGNVIGLVFRREAKVVAVSDTNGNVYKRLSPTSWATTNGTSSEPGANVVTVTFEDEAVGFHIMGENDCD